MRHHDWIALIITMSVCLTECNTCPNKNPIQNKDEACSTCSDDHEAIPSNCQNTTILQDCADYLAINCDACEITDTKYPCSNFLTKSINKGSSKSVPRPNCNNKIPTYSCPKCFSCSAFILKCSQLTINDTIQTIHDANKLTVDPNVSNSEYNESFDLTNCTGDLLRDYVCSSVIRLPSNSRSKSVTRLACSDYCYRYQRTCPFLRVGDHNTLHGGQPVLQCTNYEPENCYNSSETVDNYGGVGGGGGDGEKREVNEDLKTGLNNSSTKNQLNYLFWLLLVSFLNSP